ncbi:MAG: TonB family protein [Bryobacteraceae bacterium]|jgi:TonB family protein
MTENWKEWEGRLVDGRFPLLQYLGGGAGSAVFATATDDQTIPKAAIKLVQAGPDDAASQLVRWESAARLSHPHLVRLFRAARCQLDGAELIYVVMERADEDLSQVLPQRTLSAAEALEVLEPALDALAYVHAQGFVHGRVRPSNLLAFGDQLKLSSDRLCPAGESRRHPEERDVYDAPEETGAAMTPAADVWSLGVTLVEALTQCPSTLPPELPAPFLDIVRGCLERDPGRRWTVAQIQARLRPAGKPRGTGTRWLYGALAALVVAAAIVAGPRLVRRQAEPEKAQPASVAEQSPAAAPPAPSPAAEESKTPATGLVETPRAEQSPAAAVPAPPPAPEEPNTSAPALASGGVLRRVLPEVLPAAQRSIRGKVKVSVKIRVDPAGGVADAELASPGPSRYFAGKSLEAARKWAFTPSGPNEWLLHFEFDRGGIRVSPEAVTH